MGIVYAEEKALRADEFISVLKASGLDERRPLHDLTRIEAMLRNANVTVSARDNGRLVGVSRGLSDFAFCFYLSDLAVAREYQGRGIGRQLISRSHRLAGAQCTILTAAPGAATHYPHIGMVHVENCWIIPNDAQGALDGERGEVAAG